MLLAGVEVVLPTRTGLRNAAFMQRFGEFVAQFGATLIAGVPTVIAGLLALELDSARLHRVRAMLTGGSPLPNELAAAFEARHGIPVRNILGMTESAGVISIEPLAAARTPGSCGLPLPFCEVAVQRTDGRAAAPGESGIVRVRGPHVSPGYSDASRNAGTGAEVAIAAWAMVVVVHAEEKGVQRRPRHAEGREAEQRGHMMRRACEDGAGFHASTAARFIHRLLSAQRPCARSRPCRPGLR